MDGVGLFIWAFLFSGFWTQELVADFRNYLQSSRNYLHIIIYYIYIIYPLTVRAHGLEASKVSF